MSHPYTPLTLPIPSPKHIRSHHQPLSNNWNILDNPSLSYDSYFLFLFEPVFVLLKNARSLMRSHSCLSVCLSVCPSVRPSVRPSVYPPNFYRPMRLMRSACLSMSPQPQFFVLCAVRVVSKESYFQNFLLYICLFSLFTLFGKSKRLMRSRCCLCVYISP
jgi:hypothetical protein